MKICIVGSGAMGGLYGARLIMAGEEVVFVDNRQLVVDNINNQGLHLTGVDGEHWICYEDSSELIDKIHYYNNNPNEAEKIAKTGKDFVINNHRPHHRIEYFLKQRGLL